MLLELRISNFILVQEQCISFRPGLNVISGETGAGKSVVLQALDLILGGRPKARMLRAGATEWNIQGVFDLSGVPKEVRASLPALVEGDELVVSRSMTRAGRGRVFINGQLGTVSLLEQITQKIINVCGQGQHIRLLEPSYHLQLIDGYGRHGRLLESYKKAYETWKEERALFLELEARREKNILRQAELELVVAELSGQELYEGLRDELEVEVKRLSSVAESLTLGGRLLGAFTREKGLYDQIANVRRGLGELARVDESTSGFGDHLFGAEGSLEDLERVLRAYVQSLSVDERSLDSCRDRLAEVARLERKYRTNCAGLVSLEQEARGELALIDGAADLEERRARVEQLESTMLRGGEKLSVAREKTAKQLVAAVGKELAELSMPHAVLKPVQTKGPPGPQGLDHIEFFISTNKGDQASPLRKIASGGELSRIMLVLKKVLRDKSGVNVLVFDEVDTGISGKVARAVGEKLKALARSSQVLCITHLAQVASLADAHFLVAKSSEGKRTISEIQELTAKERVDEVARMLSGYEVTAATRQSAIELLQVSPPA